jgi:hypothetical protein
VVPDADEVLAACTTLLTDVCRELVGLGVGLGDIECFPGGVV